MNVKNNIIIPILITFSTMLFILVATFSVMHFFFPLSLSTWFYSLGSENVSVYYMEKSYEKTNDYKQLYSLINLSIKTNDYERVEKYYEKFIENENYNSFVLKIDASNLSNNVSNLVKSTMYSEDNYLKNRYVKSLVKQNKVDKAFAFANENSKLVISSEDVGIYVYTYIFDKQVDFSNIQNLQQFAGELETYFNNCVVVYNEIASMEQPQKVKGLIVGSRINEIAKNLKVIKNYNNSFVTLTNEEINNCVLQISKNMTQFV